MGLRRVRPDAPRLAVVRTIGNDPTCERAPAAIIGHFRRRSCAAGMLVQTSGVRVRLPSVVPGPAASPLSQALKNVLNLVRRLDVGTPPGVAKQAL